MTSKQAQRLGLAARTRISPHLERCSLLLTANSSYAHAERDIFMLTGMKVSHSTQHIIVHRSSFPEAKAKEPVKAVSADGGKVRLRTPKGEPSQWKDYKTVALHSQVCMAAFHDNEFLVNWVKGKPLVNPLTCIGDSHPGVWNLIDGFARTECRREVLDWYHLMENLYKVGGSHQRLKRALDRSVAWSHR